VRAYDPVGTDRVRAIFGDRIVYAASGPEALDGADALMVVTEWSEFRTLDIDVLRSRMKQTVVFDGRNLYDPAEMRRQGVALFSIGRADVDPGA